MDSLTKIRSIGEQSDYVKAIQRNFSYKVDGKLMRYIIPYQKRRNTARLGCTWNKSR